MAVLEKIRGMGIFISVIIGLALLSFIVDPNTLTSVWSKFSSKYDVGKMNKKSISYQSFAQRLDYHTNIQQIITGSSNLDEQGSEMVQQQAWQDFINELVLFPAIKKTGITLGEEELFDLTQGKELSVVLQQEPLFYDENGITSRAKILQFVQSMNSDPSGMSVRYWQYLEENISQTQLYIKYFSLLDKSTTLSTIEIQRSIQENNNTSDVSFVMKPISFATDTTIQITTQEIKDYYEKHKSFYEQNAGRDIDYVQFTIIPSLIDIERAEREIEKSFEEFSTTTNIRSFLARYSEKAFDSRYYKEGELSSISPVLDSFAFRANLTQVLPITREGDSFFSARVNSKKMMPDSAFVQHILIGASQSSRADSLVDVIKKGGNIDALATQFSLASPAIPERPGELGWVTAQMYGGALDSCLTAPLNTPFSITSQYGIHILKVTGKTKPLQKVQVAVLEKTAVAGKETFQTYYNQANELVVKSNNKGSLFSQVANENGWPIFPAYGITESAKTVANISNARELTRWAYDAKQGEVSPIISIDNKYFIVATLTGIQEKGITHLNTKRFEIETELRREKEVEKMAESMLQIMSEASNIEELADILGTTVSKQTGITFGSPGMQQLDPNFIGAISGSSEGILKGPVKGMIGVYAFTVDDRQYGAFFTEEDALRQHRQMLSRQDQMAVYVLSKNAKVEDRRAKFF